MVRAQGKQTPDEKKEAKKKSVGAAANSVKKKPDTGSWPCKMDGCKKVFAREADLKRHQRTTKTHSIPGFQCPQCDATFTRTDALRRHQKSRHNGVVIEPIEQDKDKDSGEGRSSASRSPSPAESPARSVADGSVKGSPSAGPSSSAGGSSGRASSYYRPHTMQDGFYAGYHAPRPPPGMMMDPHYPPPPMGLPTSATRGSWQPAAVPPPWPGPDGQPLPPPGMYIPASYYPSPYYRHPGMPPHLPQINPELLAQSNGNGIGPPESSLRNTSADVPRAKRSASTSPSVGPGEDSQRGEDEGPDESTLMAAAALQAVLAYQKEKEQEAREAEARATSSRANTGKVSTASQSDARSLEALSQVVRVERPPDAGPSVVPTTQIDPDLVAPGERDGEATMSTNEDEESSERGKPEEFVSEGGTPMLNPAELLTQESLASPPPGS